MALSQRCGKIAQTILKDKIPADVVIDSDGLATGIVQDWIRHVKKTGIAAKTAEQIVYAATRGLEDEEEIRIWFVNDRNTGEKDDWVVLTAVQDVDGTVFVGVTPGILAETKSVMGLARYLRKMVESQRPAGRPFGVQPSAN